jgi:hypothetical protein
VRSTLRVSSFSAALALALACAPSSRPAPSSFAEASAEPVRERAELRVQILDGFVDAAWSEPDNLIFCRHDPDPAGGDYLWIRLARSPEADGEADEHVDIDVCRFSRVGSGALRAMPAGQHGSHCARRPGFAVWYHQGETVLNSGLAPPPTCELELDYDEVARALRGRFACAPLVPAESPHDESAELPPDALELDGSFSCRVEPM